MTTNVKTLCGALAAGIATAIPLVSAGIGWKVTLLSAIGAVLAVLGGAETARRMNGKGKPPTIPPVLLLALFLAGCASFPSAATPLARCDYLDSARVGWYAVATVAGGLGTASLATSAAWGEDETAAIVVPVTGALFGALGVAAGAVAQDYAASWAEECSE